MNNRWRALYKLTNQKFCKNLNPVKCPYCKTTPLEYERYVMDNTLMEQSYYCSNCSYCEEYITGDTLLSNKEFEIGYSYLTPRNEIQKINKTFDEEMKKYIKKLKQQKKKYYRK